MAGRPRKIGYEKYRVEYVNVHELLTSELGAVLIHQSDKTVPAKWAPPLEEKQKEEVNIMGLFDQYAAEGMDLGEVKLNPFAFEDGVYEVAFVGAELLDPSQEGWDPQIQFDYVFVAMGDGSPTSLRDRRYQEKFRYPITVKHDDDDKAKAARGAIDRIAQRMYSLGVKDPLNADIADINELKSNRYIVKLTTPTPKQGQQQRQFFNVLTAKKSDDEATKSFFDQD
jgi:hypothetical protein